MGQSPPASGTPSPPSQSQDRQKEIIDALTPYQTLIITMRANGMTNGQIGALLGITHQGVNYHVQKARQRVIETYPELKPLIRGRTLYGRRRGA